MTERECRDIREKELAAMEARLRDIIGVYIDNTEEGTPAYTANMPKYRKLLDSPVLMRKTAEVFDDEFWNDDGVVNLEYQAAATAIERVTAEPEDNAGFAIIRDGKRIALTDDELRAIRRHDTKKHLRGELDDWLTALLNSDDEEYATIDGFLADKRNIEALIAMLPDEFTDCLTLEFDDRNWDAYYEVVDSLFRTRVRKLMDAAHAESSDA